MFFSPEKSVKKIEAADIPKFEETIKVLITIQDILSSEELQGFQKELQQVKITARTEELVNAVVDYNDGKVNQFLDTGADVNQVDKDGITLLNMAILSVVSGKKDMLELLIERGADVNLAYEDGWTPLHFATVLGEKEIVKLLLGQGAAVDQANSNGDTPLMIAADNGHAAGSRWSR